MGAANKTKTIKQRTERGEGGKGAWGREDGLSHHATHTCFGKQPGDGR